MAIVITIIIYSVVLLLVSRFTGRASDNESFFYARRRSPWPAVAFGMIGASISGVSFVSVPGMVLTKDMTYLQTCMGFAVGYIVVAFVLLPLYYRNNLNTIYHYLLSRFGNRTYKTGASLFVLSELLGASVRFYVVCFILHHFVFKALGIPFFVTASVLVALIWFYTRRGGVRTLVWTDVLHTLCMLAALVLIVVIVCSHLDVNIKGAMSVVADSGYSRVFVFDDFISAQNFFKQFVSGIFIVVVMTGLNQNMMQKNLTCKSLRDAQKDMCTYGFAFLPVNMIFLVLGILLVALAADKGMALPADGDSLLPMFAATGELGILVLVLFSVGIVASSFSSADSALTSLTTSVCVDLIGKDADEQVRHRVHLLLASLFVVFILLFKALCSTNIIDAVYILCSYTYGPLLGMFAFGVLTKRKANDRIVPLLAVASPLLCLLADILTPMICGYKFGYELLLLNGLIMFCGMHISGMLPDVMRSEKK